MVIHERVADVKGVGKWDSGTTRYIPHQGGSRSRLPVYDDPEYRRYYGFVGMGEELTATVHTMDALYQHLGGTPVVREGHGSVFIRLILEQTLNRLKGQPEDAG
jgi:hypothetical protein